MSQTNETVTKLSEDKFFDALKKAKADKLLQFEWKDKLYQQIESKTGMVMYARLYREHEQE